ncbi:hypothetical protein SAMN04488028_10222 [Reichenbachiella agariperforans]|uniref:Uncharacterized protein n=1 Tax=Reichenbachiella agariperforans TaxID=156994 RepID=A0A1M6MZD9_REIAG|nr:hypothetical protein SAMN04488028_10222 [Reichenbachiella agariperforans]
MSRKTKSELSFIIKISILFILLFASKLTKPDRDLAMGKTSLTKKDSVFVINAHNLK